MTNWIDRVTYSSRQITAVLRSCFTGHSLNIGELDLAGQLLCDAPPSCPRLPSALLASSRRVHGTLAPTSRLVHKFLRLYLHVLPTVGLQSGRLEVSIWFGHLARGGRNLEKGMNVILLQSCSAVTKICYLAVCITQGGICLVGDNQDLPVKSVQIPAAPEFPSLPLGAMAGGSTILSGTEETVPSGGDPSSGSGPRPVDRARCVLVGGHDRLLWNVQVRRKGLVMCGWLREQWSGQSCQLYSLAHQGIVNDTKA